VRARRAAKNRTYKLIGVDLDGTLLGPDGNPHPADVAALRAVKERGVHVTVITGRLYAGTRAAAGAIGAVGPVACADGSHIVDGGTHETVLHRGLQGSGADVLRDALRGARASTFVFSRETIFHDERGRDLLPYVRIWSEDLRETALFENDIWNVPHGLTAVVAIGHETEIHGVVARVSQHESVQVNHFPIRRVGEKTWGMIVRSQGGTKGSALEYIAKHHGIDVDECVVVGDWHNDVPMLSVAGRAFAMGQAPEAVKDAATDVLEETVLTGGGIARAIAEAFGGRA
jgi:Cof subfamily protein (haloacid dehalogenase superfamily)